MFEKIREKLMDLLNLFKSRSIEDLMGIETCLSPEMYQRIQLWQLMMQGRAPWNKDAPSCGILNEVAGKLNHMVMREIGLRVENPAIEKPMKDLNEDAGLITEYITEVGGVLLRPIYTNKKLQYELIPLGNYIPTSYDYDRTLTGALILKQITEKRRDYLLIEEHSFKENTHSVSTKLYRVDNGSLHEVSLETLEQTADLTPEYVWQNVKQPLIVEFRNRAMNKVDRSKVPVALIAGCEDLIKEADEQWERMNWEQEGGKMRVFADSDMFKKSGARGSVPRPLEPSLYKLIVQFEGNGIQDGAKITEHAPALRTTAQNEMLQQIFRRIELTMNIGKGSISDMQSVQQTASQYNGGRQELFAIIDVIEDELAAKYKEAAIIFAHMAAAYKLGSNNSNIEIIWNEDQTRKDITAAKTTAMAEVSSGIKNKWEYRMEFFGEDEETAKEKVPQQDIAPDLFPPSAYPNFDED